MISNHHWASVGPAAIQECCVPFRALSTRHVFVAELHTEPVSLAKCAIWLLIFLAEAPLEVFGTIYGSLDRAGMRRQRSVGYQQALPPGSDC